MARKEPMVAVTIKKTVKVPKSSVRGYIANAKGAGYSASRRRTGGRRNFGLASGI